MAVIGDPTAVVVRRFQMRCDPDAGGWQSAGISRAAELPAAVEDRQPAGKEPAMTEHTAALAGLDAESAEWPQALAYTGPRREEALARLHGLLVRTARGEVARRGPRLQLTGPELDDLACPAVRLLARGVGRPRRALVCAPGGPKIRAAADANRSIRNSGAAVGRRPGW